MATVFAAIAYASVTIAGRTSQALLERRLDTYAAKGEPVSLAQLPDFIPEVDQMRNTAAQFQDEIRLRADYLLSKEFAEIKRTLSVLDTEDAGDLVLCPEDVPAAEAFLASEGNWLELLHRASAYDGLSTRDHRGRHSYSSIRHPFSVVINHGVGCLVLEGLVRVRQGDVDGAIASTRAAKELNDQLLTEPYVGNLVLALCRERDLLQLVRQIAACGGSASGLPQLLPLAMPAVSRNDVRRCFQMERLGGLDYYNLQDSPFDFQDTDSLTYLSSFPRVIACRKVNEYLDFMDACIGILDLPIEMQPAVALAIERSRMGGIRDTNPLLSLAPPVAALISTYAIYERDSRVLTRELRDAAAAPLRTAEVAKDKCKPI